MRAIAPISTRGTGILTVMTCSAAQLLRKAPPAVEMPVLPLYRVTLALFQQKYARICSELSATSQIPRKKVVGDLNLDNLLSQLGKIPKPMQMMLDCIGSFTLNYAHDEVTFLPPDLHNSPSNLLLPDAGNILLNNLRATVVALANPATPVAYRRAFHEENPIPHTQWNADILMNPDDIIIPGYTIEDNLRQDVRLCRAFFNRIEKYAKNWFVPYNPFISNTKGRREASIVLERKHRIQDILRDEDPELWLHRAAADFSNLDTLYFDYDANAVDLQIAAAVRICEIPSRPLCMRWPFWCRREPRCQPNNTEVFTTMTLFSMY